MLRIFSYRIPFKLPFKTAGQTFSHREGLIVSFTDSHVTAYGEIAPLPGFSMETLKQVREVLITNHSALDDAFYAGEADTFIEILDQIHHFPSLSFGLDTLNYDLQAKKQRVSLPQFLFEQFSSQIETNAVLSIQEKSTTLQQAQEFVDAGFSTLKLKVGKNFEHERSILTSLRKQFPKVKLRIDANQAWSVAEAIEQLKALESLDIEYCEQPVPADDISSLKEVSDQVSIPIAADESVGNKKIAEELIVKEAADLIIIKPMLMGTFRNISVTKQLADTHNIDVVCTTSMETAIGRSAVAALAAGLASKNKAQGLSTGSLLSSDVSDDHWLNTPVIKFSGGPGLGISVHLENLKELT